MRREPKRSLFMNWRLRSFIDESRERLRRGGYSVVMEDLSEDPVGRVSIDRSLKKTPIVRRDDTELKDEDQAMFGLHALADDTDTVQTEDRYIVKVAELLDRLALYEEETIAIEEYLDYAEESPREEVEEELLKMRDEARTAYYLNDLEKIEEGIEERKRIPEHLVTAVNRYTEGLDHSEISKGSRRELFMVRRKDLLSPVFIVVNFKTAMTDEGSAYAVSLVKVRRGEVIDEYTTLIRPSEPLESYKQPLLTYEVGQSEIESADDWSKIGKKVEKFIGGLPVYSPSAQRDSRVWERLDEENEVLTHPYRIFSTSILSKKMLPSLGRYRLGDLLRTLAPDHEFKFRKDQLSSDANKAARVMIGLQKLYEYDESMRK